MLNLLSIFVNVMIMSACISEHSVNKNLEDWQGKSSSAIHKAWGEPDRIENSLLIYSAQDRGVEVYGVNYLDSAKDSVVQVHDGFCQIVFEIGGDKNVKGASWTGSIGRCYQYSLNQQK